MNQNKKIMEKEIMKEKLISFLEAEGVREKFERNLSKLNQKSKNIDKLINYCIRMYKMDAKYILIQAAFPWIRTPYDEGHLFWSEIDDKWHEVLDKE